MTRYAAGIEYHGQHYCGWQKQLTVASPSVQAVVEKSLSFVANHPVDVVCCGRTDSGVHAINQVIHFDSDAVRSERQWLLGANANLPADVVVNWLVAIDDDFHARFAALARRYVYVIFNHPVRSALFNHLVTWQLHPLDHEKMHQAASALKGNHDFSSFRAAQCQANHPMRCIESISLVRQGHFVIMDIKANAFLHHMVRNIVGSLFEVGTGKQPVEWIGELLQAQDRTLAAPTAPAQGLYLAEVDYPEQYQLPKGPQLSSIVQILTGGLSV